MVCKTCGRKLRDYKSIGRGYGPVCYGRKIGKLHIGRNIIADRQDEQIPGQMGFEDFPEIMPKGDDADV